MKKFFTIGTVAFCTSAVWAAAYAVQNREPDMILVAAVCFVIGTYLGQYMGEPEEISAGTVFLACAYLYAEKQLAKFRKWRSTPKTECICCGTPVRGNLCRACRKGKMPGNSQVFKNWLLSEVKQECFTVQIVKGVQL